MALTGPCLYVNVLSPGLETMKFTVQKEDRVKKIHEQVRSKTKIPVERQKLSLGPKILKPEKKLSHYWLDPNTTIHLTLKVVEPSNEAIDVFLMEVDEAKKHPFRIRPSDSVSQVKEVIKAITGVPPKAQTITCNGKNLEDGKLMCDYRLQKGNILFLSWKAIGG